MIAVRPGRPDDADTLRAIDAVAWDGRSTPAPLPLGGGWLDDLDYADLIVAELDGRVAGYALIGPKERRFANHHIGLIRSIAVHPGLHGRGVGKALIAACVDAGRSRGWLRLMLYALGTNAPALALYRSAGFQVVARLVDHFRVDGALVDDLTLDLDLRTDPPEPEWLTGGCHCDAVRFRVCVRRWDVLDCNCSMCTKKRLLHLIVDAGDFELLKGQEALATYRFGTGVAEHHFCRTCGIHPFYRPRSHPDGWDVNAACLDDDGASRFRVLPFDGRNWEQKVGTIR